MVITFWHSCVVLSCIVIPCMFAKPFNLNEAIAAEEKQKGLQTTTRPQFQTETSERFSLNKILRTNPITSKKLKTTDKSERFSLSKALLSKLKTSPLKSKKLKITENILPRGKKISPLQYRKTFQIKSPLKPKKLKNIEKARLRRKNQSKKREINEDEKVSKKYIPLLRSLSLLFDNILSGADDSFEARTGKLRKYRHSKRNSTSCSCNDKSNKDNEIAESIKETVVSTSPVDQVSTLAPEPTTTEAPTTTTDSASNSDVSDFRQNTDVPPILPRDPVGSRGDHNGVSEGSGPTLHTSTEGYISGDNGNSERDTGSGKHKPDTENNEEDPDGTTREHASSTDFRRRIRDGSDTLRPVYRRGMDGAVDSIERENDDSVRKNRRDFNEFKGQNNSKRKNGLRYAGRNLNESSGENNHEARGDETESSKPVQQFVRGDTRFLSEESDAELQPQEEREEGIVGITHYISNEQRPTDGNGASTKEDQKVSPTNAALISIKDLNNPIIMLQNSPKHKAPFVTIIDGYSVARDKNGANKLSEQSIRFHS